MSILILLIDTVGGLFVMAILLRFLLQLVKADFYNPISQAIVKVTSPLLNPLRRIIPGIGGYDIASLVLAFIVQGIFVVLKMKGCWLWGSSSHDYRQSDTLLPAQVLCWTSTPLP